MECHHTLQRCNQLAILMPFSAFVLNNYHDKISFTFKIVSGVNSNATLHTNFTPA